MSSSDGLSSTQVGATLVDGTVRVDEIRSLPEQVGQLLTALRGDTSRAEQARDLGIGRSQLARLEGGTWNITLSRLQELADSYGVTLHMVALDPATGRPLQAGV